jgi:hypothetical protein
MVDKNPKPRENKEPILKRPCELIGDYPGFYILKCSDGKKHIIIDSVLSDIPEHVEYIYQEAKKICPDCE